MLEHIHDQPLEHRVVLALPVVDCLLDRLHLAAHVEHSQHALLEPFPGYLLLVKGGLNERDLLFECLFRQDGVFWRD